MILSLAVALGLIASLARHRSRSVEQIIAIPLCSAWLALLALVLQWPLLRAPSGWPQQVPVQQIFFLLSHLLLLAFVWRNRRLAGMRLMGLGLLLNLVVIVVNGGWMPITPETLVRINPGSAPVNWPPGLHYGYSKDLILLRQETILWVLSDIIVLPPPFPWPAAFSLGDLIVAAGIVWLLQGPGVLPNPNRDESRSLRYLVDGVATMGSGSTQTGDKGGTHR
jgi:hypothetical protein